MTSLAPTSPAGVDGGVLALSTGDVRVPVYPPASACPPRRADQAYPHPGGADSLRHAVSGYAAATGARVRAEQVFVAPGARLAILCVLAGAVTEHRHVLLPSPYWASYPVLIAAAGGIPVIVPGKPGQPFPDLDLLEAMRTPGTGALVVNSPRNPDGQVVAAPALRALVEWTAAHRIVLIFDQVYRGVPLPAAPPPSVLDLFGELPGHCAVIDSLSKSHALAGLRIGWALAAGELLTSAVNYGSHILGGTSMIAQEMAVAALGQAHAFRAELGEILQANLASLLGELAGIPCVTCARPQGGIFVFPDIRAWLAARAPAPARKNVTAWLRAAHHVAVADGAAFGAPGHIRLSFALPPSQVEAGGRALRLALTEGTGK